MTDRPADVLPAGAEAILAECAPLVDAFAAAGRRLYLVGGLVRDLYGGTALDEVDLDFTTDAPPSEVKAAMGPIAEARVTGMDGGSGADLIASRGETGILVDDVAATASATGVSVQLGVVSNGAAIGAALVDTSTTARTTVTGLQGGAGDDAVLNAGSLTLRNLKADLDNAGALGFLRGLLAVLQQCGH